MKFSVYNCDFLEYLTEDSNPVRNLYFFKFYLQMERSQRHYPILDFTEYDDPDHRDNREEALKVIYAVSNSNSNEPLAQISIENCRVELDLSIVDRLADLIVSKPFFGYPYTRNRQDAFNR